MKQRIQFCTSRTGAQIAYATAGAGPPLLRVANWFTHLEFDWDTPFWRHWSEALAERRTLIRYDLRGSGLSDRDVADLSLDAMVSDVEAVVDAAKLKRVPIFGLCQGATIAAAYAARHPERVSRLVLYDGYLHGAFAPGAGDHVARQAQMFTQMIELGWGRQSGAFREVFANLLMPDAEKGELRWVGELQRRSASPEAACRLWNAFHELDVRNEAPKIRAPTLVFHVRGNVMVPFEAGRRLAAAIPNARLVPLESRNHLLLPDEPAWRVFRKELNEFLGAGEPVESPEASELAALTARETDILDRIARGLTNGEIAASLHIAEKTVRNHVTAIFSKLGTEHRAQAVVIARQAGLGRD